MNELFSVKDKVVVITGGAGILGKGIAAYLAKEGAKIVILDRSEEAGNALVQGIKAEGGDAMFLYTDVMNKEVLEGNKAEIMKAYGRIDVLLNAAGGNMPGAIGIPEDMLREAAKMAVCKINIDSDLRLAMTGTIRKYFNEHPEHFDPRQYLGPARTAIKEMVAHKIKNVLGCDGQA